MSQDEMVKFWGYSKRTVNDYLEQLENMQLIYVYRHNKRRTDGTYYKINNSYGRYADRDMIIAEAQKYAGTVECEDEFKKLDRRSIKMRYNAFCNGSRKYIDAPAALLDLYSECLLYNKSLKFRKIEGSYDGEWKQGEELDLSVFPQEIINILEKYQDSNSKEIKNINMSIQNITTELKSIRKNLSMQLQTLTDCEQIDEREDELLQDSKTLRNYIGKIETISINPIQIEPPQDEDNFTKQVRLYVTDDDLCPFCMTKFIKHRIYYQRKISNKRKDDAITGYRCPACNCLFVLDYETEDFDFNNTNIKLKNTIENKIFFTDAIVVFNINKCSAHNHDIRDITCKIPVIVPNGDIVYGDFPIIHCKTCNRYIMLKSTYDTINGIPACIIIDDTNSSNQQYTENDFIYGENSGSKLHQYGYNVNNQDKLTEEQRHTILTMQLLSKNITKGEICSILDTNINRGSNRQESKRDWSKAVAKWKADKEFVLNLDLNKASEIIGVDRLILKYHKNDYIRLLFIGRVLYIGWYLL